jgi:hypothetical protein
MEHSTLKTTRRRLNPAKTGPQTLAKGPTSAEPQAGGVTLPTHIPPQVVRKLVGRAPNSTLQSLVGANGGPVPELTEQVIQREVGGGQPLASTTQAQMGGALGANLSGVRVHNDDTSDNLAGQLGARAFTVGSDVFFAANEYQPATTGGQKVLAHELAHVMQDSNAPQFKLQVGSVDDPAEAEADAVAQRVTEAIPAQAAAVQKDERGQELSRAEDEEEKVQMARRQSEDEEEEVQMMRRQEEPDEEEVQTLRREAEPEDEEARPLRP